MIYTCVTGDNTLLFYENRHQIASINFKTEHYLYKFLKECVFFNNYDFIDLLKKEYINYSTLTKKDITFLNNNYENYLSDFINHINNIERG